MDRRIERTKHSLQASLLSLIREMPYEDIEIQAITDRANTARVSFYRHYAAKNELLFDCLATIYEQILAAMGTYDLESVLDLNRKPPCLPLFAFLETDRELYRRLALGSVGALVQQRVRAYIVDENLRIFGQSPRFADAPIGLIANHIASCEIGNLVWWLTDDNPYPAEYIARMSHAMSVTGAMLMIGRLDEVILPAAGALAPA
ncbi:MAG: TetR/AcrR family transcriptional regulator [Chloroflexi bacterium]|nr:TetR/AcrR family transcriptional regulator [Chloroflexota bacterium]